MRLKSWTPLEIIETVLAVNVLIWGVIFLFPGNLFENPHFEDSAEIIQDWWVGIFLTVVGLLLLITPRASLFHVRRYLHIACWLFWFSMTFLAANRVFFNGVSPGDFLFLSLAATVALIHLTLYTRLIGVK